MKTLRGPPELCVVLCRRRHAVKMSLHRVPPPADYITRPLGDPRNTVPPLLPLPSLSRRPRQVWKVGVHQQNDNHNTPPPLLDAGSTALDVMKPKVRHTHTHTLCFLLFFVRARVAFLLELKG